MSKYFSISLIDWYFSLFAWFASIILFVYHAPLGLSIIATTLNLIHQRKTLYNAGAEFQARVRAVVEGDLNVHVLKMQVLERGVNDVKEAQVKIAGTFRGRT